MGRRHKHFAKHLLLARHIRDTAQHNTVIFEKQRDQLRLDGFQQVSGKMAKKNNMVHGLMLNQASCRRGKVLFVERGKLQNKSIIFLRLTERMLPRKVQKEATAQKHRHGHQDKYNEST
jgi:hypothetical protein